MQLMACSPQELLSIRGIEESVKEAPQLKIEIKEVLHAGVYTRIAIVPENVLLVGALMKVPTTLVVVGRCAMTVNGGRDCMLYVPAGKKNGVQDFRSHETNYVVCYQSGDAWAGASRIYG